MKTASKLTIFALIFSAFVVLLLHPQLVAAQTCTDNACTGCDGTGQEVKVDLSCQRKRLITPCSPKSDSTCCTLLYCQVTDANGQTSGGSNSVTPVLDFNFFGVKLHIDQDKQVASFIYLLFSFFFAFVAIAVTLLGVYGAFLRSRAASADDEAKASKLLSNAVTGLIIIVVSIVIVQIVASTLGLGSIDKMVDFSGTFSQT